jgi:hypothetical protein
MNPHSTLYRKGVYLALLAIIALPLAWMGMPSTRDDAGGKLAELRTEHKLGQADLGAIDPASEAMRLATLGGRGFVVTMLWNKANEDKKTEDWTSFQATLEQLARLQPYFTKVWQYQAWNLSYNVSVEVDNVRDRFFYVKQGINYLKEGINYLRDSPTLLDDLGWFTGNKVGRADEHEIYRRLFKADKDLTGDRPPEQRDNWLVSKDWYADAIASIDEKKHPLGTKNPTTFFDSIARAQISYAEAIEDEGVFRTRAKNAWEEGARLWREYGEREMPGDEDLDIRLEDLELWQAKAKELREKLDAMSPGLEGKLREEAVASLSPEQRDALKSSAASPTPEQAKLQQEAYEATHITAAKIADRIAKDDPAQASAARALAGEIARADRRVNLIEINRDVANYEYWKIRSDLEQTDEALEARELAHAADRVFKEKASPTEARALYERSFDAWAKALAKFPELPADSSSGSDLLDLVKEYEKVLEQLDLSLADPEVGDAFPLWHIVEANDQQRDFAEAIAAHKGLGSTASPLPEVKPLVNPADAYSEGP